MILVYAYEFPAAIGGVGTFVFNLVDYLNRNKFKPVVLTQHFSPEDKLFDKKQSFMITRMPGTRNTLISFLIGIFFLLFILIRLRPKIILAADILSQRIISLLLFLKLINKKKIFLLCHGSEIMANYNENRFKRILFTHMYHKAPLIIANSRYTKDLLLQKQIPEDKIIIINPGLHNTWFKDNSGSLKIREELNLVNANIILTVARLSYRKGQDIVISLMPRILKELPNTRYLIVGEGEDHMKLKEMVYKNNLEDKIRFIGKVTREDLADYYDACDIFVMPSREVGNLTEGFGISFIEAGARAKPVIGMKVGGVKDAIVDGQTGYLLEPGDTEGFISAIIYLLKNKEIARQLGENAKKHVYNKFCWKDSNECRLAEIFK